MSAAAERHGVSASAVRLGRDPAHVHVEQAERYAKVWLSPVALAASRGFRSAEWNEHIHSQDRGSRRGSELHRRSAPCHSSAVCQLEAPRWRRRRALA